MALLNIENEEYKKKCEDQFFELKKRILKEENLKDIIFSYDHILYLESLINEQQEELKKYKRFFIAMKELLPPDFNTSTPIY